MEDRLKLEKVLDKDCERIRTLMIKVHDDESSILLERCKLCKWCNKRFRP